MFLLINLLSIRINTSFWYRESKTVMMFRSAIVLVVVFMAVVHSLPTMEWDPAGKLSLHLMLEENSRIIILTSSNRISRVISSEERDRDAVQGGNRRIDCDSGARSRTRRTVWSRWISSESRWRHGNRSNRNGNRHQQDIQWPLDNHDFGFRKTFYQR